MHLPPHVSRRLFVRSSAAFLAGASLLPSVSAQTSPPKNPPPTKPPTLPLEQVRDIVGHAHRSLEQVRKLVEATPLLVNACWDQGGGDFETPLEAAAHTGGHEIATYLLSQGARPSVFAAAMLGQLDLVQAFFVIDPDIHALPGPHGFTVLHCARQSGAVGKPVVDWLLARGVPDVKQLRLRYIWPPGTEPKGA
jgi:hypothetical protein